MVVFAPLGAPRRGQIAGSLPLQRVTRFSVRSLVSPAPLSHHRHRARTGEGKVPGF